MQGSEAERPVPAERDSPRPAGSVRRSALVAALLSSLIPGLGQAWAGAPRRAVVIALPVAAVAVGAIAVTAWGSWPDMAVVLLSPAALAVILVLDGVLLAYRLVAIVDAFRLARRRWGVPARRALRAASIGLLALLIALNASLHAAVAYVDLAAYELATTVFGGDIGPADPILVDEPVPTPAPSPTDTPRPTTAPDAGGSPRGTIPPWRRPDASEPTATPAPTPTPVPPPPPDLPAWARDGRLDLLLVGTDAGPDRWKLRTDTMILLSVDVRSGRAAIFGIPRNLVNVPLPDESAAAFPCRCYPRLINSLWVYADGHPDRFPGERNRGWRAVAGAIRALTGSRIDGLVVVDLAGFIDLVDAVGGIRINVPKALHDARYPRPDGGGLIELHIGRGWQRMDGATALAYARSRHQDSDYGRMRRQQEVLLAVRRTLKPCRVIGRLPDLLPIVKRSAWTTLKLKELPGLVELAARVRPDRIERYSLTPPRYPSHLRSADVDRIRTLVGGVFDRRGAPPPPLAELPDSHC